MFREILERCLAVFLLLCFLPAILIVSLMIVFSSNGPALYWSKRVGKHNTIFLMPKFRSMRNDTPNVATHLLKDSGNHVTRVGSIIRRTSIDEIPQLWSIVTGDMNFVGPRPALFNQNDLIIQRTKLNIHLVKPGITGWAQINGRDELSIQEKVEMDLYYVRNRSVFFDYRIIFRTIIRVVNDKSITH